MRRPANANDKQFAMELLENSIELLAVAGLCDRVLMRACLPCDCLMPAKLLRISSYVEAADQIVPKYAAGGSHRITSESLSVAFSIYCFMCRLRPRV